MIEVASYLILVALYVGLIAFCLSPLVRRRGPIWIRTLGAILGFMLLGASALPPLAFPVLYPAYQFGGESGLERVQSATLFARTLPIMIENIRERTNRSTMLVEIAYPIEISGHQFEPVFHTVCTTRRTILLDKGAGIMDRPAYPTAIGGTGPVIAGDALVFTSKGLELCSLLMLGKLQTGPIPDDIRGFQPSLHLIVGYGERTIYELQWRGEWAKSGGIRMLQPRIMRIEPVADKRSVPIENLWPMLKSDEASGRPALINKLQRLIGKESGCLTFVQHDFNLRDGHFVRYNQRRELADVPSLERQAYCLNALAPYFEFASNAPALEPLKQN